MQRIGLGDIVVMLVDGNNELKQRFEGYDHLGIVTKRDKGSSKATVCFLDEDGQVEVDVEDLIWTGASQGDIQKAVLDPAWAVYNAVPYINKTLLRIHSAIEKGLTPRIRSLKTS